MNLSKTKSSAILRSSAFQNTLPKLAVISSLFKTIEAPTLLRLWLTFHPCVAAGSVDGFVADLGSKLVNGFVEDAVLALMRCEVE